MHRRKDNIKICLGKIRYENMDRINFLSNRISCEHGNGPPGVINREESLDQLSNCQLLKTDCDTFS
jgi:hypothetical protein